MHLLHSVQRVALRWHALAPPLCEAAAAAVAAAVPAAVPAAVAAQAAAEQLQAMVRAQPRAAAVAVAVAEAEVEPRPCPRVQFSLALTVGMRAARWRRRLLMLRVARRRGPRQGKSGC